MKAKLLLGFFIIVIFALSIFMLVYYYRSIPKQTLEVSHQEIEFEKPSHKKPSTWLNSFIKKSQPYAYPATEIKINVDMRSPDEKIKATKLVIDDLDEYKFFCLKEVLNQEKLEFAYYQAEDGVNMVVYLPNDSRKNQIMQDLRYYEIKYNIQ